MRIPFYQVLDNIMSEKKISVANIASICDVPDATLRSAIRRKSDSVALEIAFKLSKGLNIPLEVINGEKPKQNEKPATNEGDGLTEIKKDFIEDIRLLSDEDIQSLQPVVKNLLKNNKE